MASRTLRDLEITARRQVPAALLTVRASRASGPGGQNVNKVATKVDVRLDLDALDAHFGVSTMQRIRAKLDARIDKDGRLFVTCDRFRSQAKNIDAALGRMEELIKKAIALPKRRKTTKPSKNSKKRRVETKRQHGAQKRQRAFKPGRDD